MTRNLSWHGFLLRWLFAILLVFLTWNPFGVSFVDYVLSSKDLLADWPIKVGLGLILLIGWVVFMRATLNALGALGLLLVLGLFATVIGGLVYYEVVSANFDDVFVTIILIFISLLLAIGMSWSHVRRRLSGQVDTDDVET